MVTAQQIAYYDAIAKYVKFRIGELTISKTKAKKEMLQLLNLNLDFGFADAFEVLKEKYGKHE